MPGGLASDAGLQAERREADPSWQKETECPPGLQWTDWKTATGGSRALYGLSESLTRITHL